MQKAKTLFENSAKTPRLVWFLSQILKYVLLVTTRFNTKRKPTEPSPSGARGRTWSWYFWLKYYLRRQSAKKLILTIDRNGCEPTVLPQGSTRFFFSTVGICFSCRREQCTSYSDGKHLKMINKHLRSAAVIMNMQKKI